MRTIFSSTRLDPLLLLTNLLSVTLASFSPFLLSRPAANPANLTLLFSLHLQQHSGERKTRRFPFGSPDKTDSLHPPVLSSLLLLLPLGDGGGGRRFVVVLGGNEAEEEERARNGKNLFSEGGPNLLCA